MRLYQLSESSRSLSDAAFDLTAAEAIGDPDRRLVGTVQPGQKVTFDRAFTSKASGETQEWLVGVMEFKGKTYRIQYFLGFQGYGGFTGWRRIFKSFDLGVPPE